MARVPPRAPPHLNIWERVVRVVKALSYGRCQTVETATGSPDGFRCHQVKLPVVSCYEVLWR